MTDFTAKDLRRAFGSFLTGVTVVTARAPDGSPVGFTANSFSSVSLEPPLLLVCPGKALSSFETFRTADHFGVSILAAGQEDVSDIFASSAADRFAKVAHDDDLHGVPLIRGAAARFSCATHQVIPAGDHIILLGEVRHVDHANTAGLGYAGGRYFSLGPDSRTRETVTHGAVLRATHQT